MNWSWLITLICPLMMIVMMFGMGGKHGHGHGQGSRKQNEQMRRDIQSLTS
jgi:hypothetical protein